MLTTNNINHDRQMAVVALEDGYARQAMMVYPVLTHLNNSMEFSVDWDAFDNIDLPIPGTIINKNGEEI